VKRQWVSKPTKTHRYRYQQGEETYSRKKNNGLKDFNNLTK